MQGSMICCPCLFFAGNCPSGPGHTAASVLGLVGAAFIVAKDLLHTRPAKTGPRHRPSTSRDGPNDRRPQPAPIPPALQP